MNGYGLGANSLIYLYVSSAQCTSAATFYLNPR